MEFVLDSTNNQPEPFSQMQLNDLVRDLNPSKESAQLLGSRLHEHRILSRGTTYSWYRNREREFTRFFDKHDSLVFCSNVPGLIEHMGIPYQPNEWRLFIDSSNKSLKAVLWYIGHKVASIPIGYSAQMTETYENLKFLINIINYNYHNFLICGDLKVIALLLGLQGGYTKYPCFLCLWDSRADKQQYYTKNWPPRPDFLPGNHNVQFVPLVHPKNRFIATASQKLGLMKKFYKVSTLNQNFLI